MREAEASAADAATSREGPGRLAFTLYRLSRWLASPSPWLAIVGVGIFFGFWYVAVELWRLPRFKEMPGLTEVFREWFARDPTYGVSLFKADYYVHIARSLERVGWAFLITTGLGVPLGLAFGWSRRFKAYGFPVFESLRPIPALAWIPFAILMFRGSEAPVIFLACIAPFFATALNTMLGVESIDETYLRAAHCLGASSTQVFFHVVIPGAMPFIFVGMQISIGLAWFSLVAAEMVSGEWGLGYLINISFQNINYPTMAIGMITLGLVGYATSALVRIAADLLLQWRVRELALTERQ